ncbi:MAG: RIP metalloprotease RseP, partial [Bacteroidales bacterium]|nr:RIP metalloprotease RseP [Bacteroidales bacterium]
GLSLLIFIHEMGHYLAARAFGIRVNKFYLFFDAWGFKLFSFKRGDTEFGIGWLPLGGYCQIAGMIDETQSEYGTISEPQPWEYRSKPAWQRLIVLFGGIFLNLITGILILSALLLGKSQGFLSNEEVSRYGISPSIVAQEIGFQRGDRILSVDGRQIVRFQDAQSINVLFGSEIEVLRGDEILTITVPRDTHRRMIEADVAPFIGVNIPVVVRDLVEGSIAAQMGILPQDRILKINNDTIHSFSVLQQVLSGYTNQDVEVTVNRNSEILVLHTTLDNTGRLGVAIDQQHPFEITPYTAFTALKFGTRDAVGMLVANARGLGQVASGQVRASESIQGPIGMAQIYGASWDWGRFWYVTGLLSLILAFMNFLPIPALDGGHIMFTLWEIITRKKPSDRFLMITQQIGMVLLLTLMVFVLGNDLFRIFR